MREADLAAVCAIEQAAYSHPWTEGIFRDCLGNGQDCWVGAFGDRPVAHAVLSIGAGECHLLNLCVHPLWQNRGLGRLILRSLLDRAKTLGVGKVFLEVRASNAPAQRLYLREGFAKIGVRRGYYPSQAGREDALVFSLDVSEPRT